MKNKDRIPLTKQQAEIMVEFYSKKASKVLYTKSKRNKIWNIATKREEIPESLELDKLCPALLYEIEQSYETGSNIQSAVFSECVYAQTLANMFDLTDFKNCRKSQSHLSEDILLLLSSYSLVPRYSYSNLDGSRTLIQAGGHNGIDSALITVMDLSVYTIEFKEPGAKTSEPDLPKYAEDGMIVNDNIFNNKYPQFIPMLEEQTDVNFFKSMGSNINDFTYESINHAITENYSSSNKFAHVCCTEDKNGMLVMMPINQIHLWAKVQGEIRPAGRNSYDVWTPYTLKGFIEDLGGKITFDKKINKEIVTVPKDKLGVRRQRGGNRKVSGYKINPLFFVRIGDVTDANKNVMFRFDAVKQLKPTISAKVFFKELLHNEVKDYYF